jgi:Ca2+-binding RTX toxin-like protein
MIRPKPFEALPASPKDSGEFFKYADIAGAVQNGATDPGGVTGEIAGILIGGWVTGTLLTAAGGLAGIIGAPVWVAVGALTLILAAGYAASQIGEAVWDALVADQLWAVLEAAGWKDDVEKFISKVGNAIDPYVPGDPEADRLVPKFIKQGEVVTGNENENIVVGNDGKNAITFLHGRTTAFGNAGNDDYTLTRQAVGNQIIDDTEGANTLSFGIVDVAGVTYTKTGDNRYASPEDYFTLVYNDPGDGGPGTLVVSSKHYSKSTVTLLNWKNGDFGISLPGMPTAPEPPTPLGPGTVEGDYINPGVTSPGKGAVTIHGLGGRDMIWGGFDGTDALVIGLSTGTDDTLYGGDDGDIINGRGGKDEIDGGSGDDYISGFGDHSTVYGGSGDDVIDARYNYGFHYVQGGVIGLTLSDVWRDIGQHFTWSRGEGFALSPEGDFYAPSTFNLASDYDYSGPSAAAGMSYRFYKNGTNYRLRYFSSAQPDGWNAGSGLITYGDNPFLPIEGVTLSGGSGNDSINGADGNDNIDGGSDNDLLAGMGGNDSINGGAGDDRIAGGNGEDVISGDAGADAAVGGLGRDVISGGEGNDQLWGDNGLGEESETGEGDYIDGGAGDDNIAGEAGDDVLDGGAGNDRVWGGAGDDVIQGRDGDDQLSGGAGHDVLLGGAGKDIMEGNDGSDSLMGGDGDDSMTGGAGTDALDGGEGNDILLGDDGDDRLDGGAGDDRMTGGAGNDRLFGREGADTIDASAGNDTLEGGDGADHLYGGADNDSVYGGAGSDYLDGDESAVAAGQHGRDLLDGGDGDDLMHGQGNDDTLYGGAGDDSLYGDDFERLYAGNDVLHGGEGNDWLVGGAGNDVLNGDSGDDVLIGDEGNDALAGGEGNNQYQFKRGFGQDVVTLAEDSQDRLFFLDEIKAGDLAYMRIDNDLLVSLGDDQVRIAGYFTGATQVRIQTSDNQVVTRAQIEAGLLYGTPVIGSEGDETLVGTEQADRLYGRGGSDMIQGLGGDDLLEGGDDDDYLVGGLGNDVLDGGAGNDTYTFSAGFGMDRVVGLADAESGTDMIRFTNGLTRAQSSITVGGEDVMIAFLNGSGFDSVVLEGFLAPTNGQHFITFADGTQLTANDLRGEVSVPLPGGTAGDDELHGTAGNDLISGGAGNDQLHGAGGNDRLKGDAGNDRLFGGDGDDILDGGSGDDVLDGGTGDDRLIGSGGADVYRYGSGYGNDTIAFDSAAGIRQVQLFDIADPSAMRYALSNGALILTHLDTLQTLTIEGYVGSDGPTARIVFAHGNELTQDMLWQGSNLIEGASDGDALYGYGGDDEIYGHNGNDLLDGGSEDDDLYGGFGEDRIFGGSGNDFLEGDADYPTLWWHGGDDDYLDGGDGNDTLWGNDGDDILIGGTGRDFISGENGNDTLNGGAGNDSLYGNAGSDTYVFGRGGGADYLREFGWIGGDDPQPGDVDTIRFDASVSAGDIVVYRSYLGYQTLEFHIEGTDDSITVGDFFYGSSVANSIERLVFADGSMWELDDILAEAMRGSYRHDLLTGLYAKDDFIDAGAGNDYVEALEHDDTIFGGAGNDGIYAGAGNDILVGGSGSDLLSGDAGNDIYRFGLGSDLDFIANGSRVVSDYDLIELGEGITAANIRLARAGDALVIDIVGHPDRLIALGNFLTDDDPLYGGQIDALTFADGTVWTVDDMLAHLGAPLDPISVNFGGDRTVTTDSGGYVIGLQGGFADVHRESAGATWYDVGPGGARLFGGAFDDSYVFGRGYGRLDITDVDGTDRIVMNADVVPGAVALHRLGDDLVVQVAGELPLKIIGFFRDGGSGAIESIAFADGTVWDSAWLHANVVDPDVVLAGTVANDTLRGGIGNDQLFGLEGDDTLDGEDGNDLLDGGSGADLMRGGKGSDTYIVDDVTDVVIDDQYADGWEPDVNVVRSSVSFVLRENLQQLLLTGTGDLEGTGNNEANVMIGNAGINVLRAAGPEDTAYTSDWLDGGAGNDSLYGSWGNDTMIGGAGADRMEGGYGHDLYFVDDAGDVVIEGEDSGASRMGSRMAQRGGLIEEPGLEPPVFGVPVPGEYLEREGDTVAAVLDYTLGENLEGLILMGTATTGTGNALDNYLAGNAVDNLLFGLDGSDRLNGGAGSDVLYGGDGDDYLHGGIDNDMLVGGEGYDYYRFAVGDGDDTIVNADSYGEDQLTLDGISFDQVDFSREGADLIATVADEGGSITIKDWYTDSSNRVDYFYDQDWIQLSADDVDARVAAGAQAHGELRSLVHAMAQQDSAGQDSSAQSALMPRWDNRYVLYAAN